MASFLLASALAATPPPRTEALAANSSSSVSPTTLDTDAPDFCPAAAVSTGGASMIVVAQAANGQVIAKAVGADGRASSWSVASPASGNSLRGGPAVAVLPRGLGMFVAVCDGAGTLRGALLRPPAGASEQPAWGAWHPLGAAPGDCGFTPTLVADERSLLHAFAVAARDGELWHGTWAADALNLDSMLSAKASADGAPLFAWQSLTARFTASPVAAIDASGELQLVGRGASGQLFHRSATHSATPGATFSATPGGGSRWSWRPRWHALDGPVRGSPRLPLRTRATPLLELVGRGRTDSAAYRLSQTPLRPPREVAWGRRQPLGGVLASAPSAAQDGNGDMHLFGLGPDGTVWHRRLAQPDSATPPPLPPAVVTPPSQWGSLGGELDSAPVAALRADGLVSVLAGGVDGQLYLKSQEAKSADGSASGWGAWRSLGGPIRAFAC